MKEPENKIRNAKERTDFIKDLFKKSGVNPEYVGKLFENSNLSGQVKKRAEEELSLLKGEDPAQKTLGGTSNNMRNTTNAELEEEGVKPKRPLLMRGILI